jgi:hypothetical protein
MTIKFKEKITAEIFFFLNKKCYLLIPSNPELQQKLSALKREHPALQNMKFIDFLLFLWVIFALDPDPNPDLDTDPDPDLQQWSMSSIFSQTLICRF